MRKPIAHAVRKMPMQVIPDTREDIQRKLLDAEAMVYRGDFHVFNNRYTPKEGIQSLITDDESSTKESLCES